METGCHQRVTLQGAVVEDVRNSHFGTFKYKKQKGLGVRCNAAHWRAACLCMKRTVLCPRSHEYTSERKNEMMNLLKRLWKEEEGQDLIEYALLVALVALAATAGMNALATKINTTFTNLGTSLTSAT
jgi:pilus assembly protein Flp/PilA